MYHLLQLQLPPAPAQAAAKSLVHPASIQPRTLAASAEWQRNLETTNWPLLREADFSGTLVNWRSETVHFPAQRQTSTLQSLDLDRILAYAG